MDYWHPSTTSDADAFYYMCGMGCILSDGNDYIEFQVYTNPQDITGVFLWHIQQEYNQLVVEYLLN